MRITTWAVALCMLVCAYAGYAHQAQAQGGTPQERGPQAKTTVDPVCGMTVDPAKAANKSEHKGTTYYFCSEHCKRTFDADPEAVLKKQPQKK